MSDPFGEDDNDDTVYVYVFGGAVRHIPVGNMDLSRPAPFACLTECGRWMYVYLGAKDTTLGVCRFCQFRLFDDLEEQ